MSDLLGFLIALAGGALGSLTVCAIWYLADRRAERRHRAELAAMHKRHRAEMAESERKALAHLAASKHLLTACVTCGRMIDPAAGREPWQWARCDCPDCRVCAVPGTPQ